MNCIIDAGNTAVKVAYFEEDKLNPVQVKSYTEHEFKKWIKNEENFENTILGSVIDHIGDDISGLELKTKGKFIQFSSTTPIPIGNNYGTKDTLGLDRLANAVALAKLFPSKNALAVDIGTCIKYDFLSLREVYEGGSISPGIKMRYKALHTFTAKLPFIEEIETKDPCAKNTKDALVSGVVNGILSEITGMISLFNEKYDKIEVVLTGGDASFFEKELKKSIFVCPYLTLIGLNEILLANVD